LFYSPPAALGCYAPGCPRLLSPGPGNACPFQGLSRLPPHAEVAPNRLTCSAVWLGKLAWQAGFAGWLGWLGWLALLADFAGTHLLADLAIAMCG